MLTVVAAPPPDDDEGKEITPPPLYSVDELFAIDFPPLVWTVPDILVRGNCDMLAGKSKMGKSRLAQSLAWSVSSGEMALGTIEVTPGDVLYLGLEDGLRRLQKRFMKIAGADPKDPTTWSSNSRLTLSDEWSPLDEGGLTFIEQWVDRSENPVLIIVDTLKRVKPAVTGRRQIYDTDYEALAPLADLAHSRNVGILVIHHTRKADAEDWLDEVSGSTGTTAATDGTIILKRKRGSKDAILYVVNRDAEDDLQLALVADPVTGGWRYVGNAEESNAAGASAEILEILIETRDPMKPAEIAPLVNRTANAVQQRLHQMMKDGIVSRTKYAAYVATDRAIADYWNAKRVDRGHRQ